MQVLSLPSYLRRWIPAVKKVAADREVRITDQDAVEVIQAAESFYTANYGHVLNKDECFARSIREVFQARLQSLASIKRMSKGVFPSDYVKPRIAVIPPHEFSRRNGD